MGIGIGSLILVGVGLLISLGGLLGLWRQRSRFARRPLVNPVCPMCRYGIADPSRPCSECGADLQASGVIDADWPGRSTYLIRGILVCLLCLPLPIILGSPVRRMLPDVQRDVAVTVIGLADAGGAVEEVLLVEETRRWLATVPVTTLPPAGAGRVTVRHALPPGDVDQRLSIRSDGGMTISPPVTRAALGDASYARRDRDRLPEPATRALPLADEIVAGGETGAVAAAGRIRASRGSGVAQSSSTGPGTAWSLRIVRWSYGPLPPGTTAPLLRSSWRTTQSLLPPPGIIVLVSVGLLAFLLGRGAWLARRFRPRPMPGPAVG
jgi:hypothetical protein